MGFFATLLIVTVIIMAFVTFMKNKEKTNVEEKKEIFTNEAMIIRRIFALEQQVKKLEEANLKYEEEIRILKTGVTIEKEEMQVKEENQQEKVEEVYEGIEIVLPMEKAEIIKDSIIENIEDDITETKLNINENIEIFSSNIETTKENIEAKTDVIEKIEKNELEKLEEKSEESLSVVTIKSKDKLSAENIMKSTEIKSEKESKPDKREFNKKIENLLSIESIISKLGILLFIIGMGFLFKFTYSMGLITKEIRVIAGIITGFAFAGLTEFMYRRGRDKLGQIFAGGSIAIFYLTIFASFYLYKMIGYQMAFGAMVIVTIAAYGAAIKYDSAALSIVGFLGGMGTPFMLYTGEGSVSGLIMYNCFIIFGTSLIYGVKGWKSLFWSALIGAWGVLVLVLFKTNLTGSERSWAEAGTIFHWVCFWSAAVGREILVLKNKKYEEPSIGYLERFISKELVETIKKHSHIVVISMPMVAMGLIMKISGIGYRKEIWGWYGAVAALIYFMLSFILRKMKINNKLEYSHILTGILFSIFSVVEFFRGDILALSLIAEGAALIIAGKYLNDRFIKRAADILLIMGNGMALKGVVLIILNNNLSINSIISYTIIMAVGIAVIIFAEEKKKKVYGIFYIQFIGTVTSLFYIMHFINNREYFTIGAGILILINYIILKKKELVNREIIHLGVAAVIIYKFADFVFTNGDIGKVGIASLNDIIFVVLLWVSSIIMKKEDSARKVYRNVSAVVIFLIMLRDFSTIKGGVDLAVIIYGTLILAGSLFTLYNKKRDGYIALETGLSLFSAYFVARYFIIFINESAAAAQFITDLFGAVVIYAVSIAVTNREIKKLAGNVAVISIILLLIRETGGAGYTNCFTVLITLSAAYLFKKAAEYKKEYINYNVISPFAVIILFEIIRVFSINGEGVTKQFAVDLAAAVVIIAIGVIEKNKIEQMVYKISGYIVLMSIFIRDFHMKERGIEIVILCWSAVYLTTIVVEKREQKFDIWRYIFAITAAMTAFNIINVFYSNNYSMFSIGVNTTVSFLFIMSSFITKKYGIGIIRNIGTALFTISLIELLQKIRAVSEENGILYIVLLLAVIWSIVKFSESRFKLENPTSKYTVWGVIVLAIGDIIFRMNSDISFERVVIQVLVVILLQMGAITDENKKRGEIIAVSLIPIMLGYLFTTVGSIIFFLPSGGILLAVLQRVYLKTKKEQSFKGVEWIFYIYTAGMILAVLMLNNEESGTTLGFVLEIISICIIFEMKRKFEKLRKNRFYEFLLHFLIIVSAYRNFAESSSGNGIISMIWGVYGVAVIIYGVKKLDKTKIYTALAIIVAVALKLLIIDLSEVEAIWKIVLFMGFGASLLAVSYYLHPILQREEMQ